ncbi:tol-pal system YbgF family protein [Saccharicrinis sp. FJH2]|uniref:tetratricopeptide repeat protein n=1 Tax=unclassified Saccharicrinis TaxID=2646859 RepID=UPI0035D48A55
MANKQNNKNHQGENFENVEQALTKSEEFIERNQKQLVIGLLIIVAIVAAVMGYHRFYLQPLEKEAQTQMFLGEQYFAADSFKLALQGDGNFLGFEYISDEYSATKSGSLAAYYAGISYMHLGDYQSAIDYLNKFDGDDDLVAPVALGAKGDCYMELGEYADAISSYKSAADYNNEFTTPIHLKKLGIAYVTNGDNDKAIQTFNTIKEKYSKSAEARDVEKYIALIK